MAIITVGPGATNRSSYRAFNNGTIIDKTNLANDSGVLNSMSVWFYTNAVGVKCGTLFGSGLAFTSRDFENLGDVAAGSKQTFSGLDCDVEIGDSLGVYTENLIYIEASTSGGTTVVNAEDMFDGVRRNGTGPWTYIVSMEASGTTPGKKWQGITISKWNGSLVSKINKI